jgi:L-aminopeptidase/D-esterase-like protein
MSLSCLIGHAPDERGGTGCTVLLFPEGATASGDVRGGAPGGRETALLDPACSVERIDALLFTGGSARLDARRELSLFARTRMGFDVAWGSYPLFPALHFRSPWGIRETPDRVMGLLPVTRPSRERIPQGNVGAGTGPCGEILGPEGA